METAFLHATSHIQDRWQTFLTVMEKEYEKLLSKESLDIINDARDTKGVRRQLLEVQNIKANTKLATETIKKLKYDFWRNILFIIIGVIIGYVPNLLSEDKTTKAIELMNTLMLEKQKQYEDFQIETNQMHLEIEFLKKEIESIKNTSKFK